MGRFNQTKKWWTPKNEAQGKLFEDYKKLIYSALLSYKDGVLIGSIMNLVEEVIGEKVPLQEMGFKNIGEFLFHVDDLFEVRIFNPRIFRSTKKFIFLKESAVTSDSSHLRKLVTKQASSSRKGRGSEPKANYATTVPTPSEELLNYYRPHYQASISTPAAPTIHSRGARPAIQQRSVLGNQRRLPARTGRMESATRNVPSYSHKPPIRAQVTASLKPSTTDSRANLRRLPSPGVPSLEFVSKSADCPVSSGPSHRLRSADNSINSQQNEKSLLLTRLQPEFAPSNGISSVNAQPPVKLNGIPSLMSLKPIQQQQPLAVPSTNQQTAQLVTRVSDDIYFNTRPPTNTFTYAPVAPPHVQGLPGNSPNYSIFTPFRPPDFFMVFPPPPLSAIVVPTSCHPVVTRVKGPAFFLEDEVNHNAVAKHTHIPIATITRKTRLASCEDRVYKKEIEESSIPTLDPRKAFGIGPGFYRDETPIAQMNGTSFRPPVGCTMVTKTVHNQAETSERYKQPNEANLMSSILKEHKDLVKQSSEQNEASTPKPSRDPSHALEPASTKNNKMNLNGMKTLPRGKSALIKSIDSVSADVKKDTQMKGNPLQKLMNLTKTGNVVVVDKFGKEKIIKEENEHNGQNYCNSLTLNPCTNHHETAAELKGEDEGDSSPSAKVEYSHPPNDRFWNPNEEIAFEDLKLGHWMFIVGQYKSPFDFMVTNGHPEAVKQRNKSTNDMSHWFSVMKDTGHVQHVLDTGLYGGFSESTKKWYRVQVDASEGNYENFSVLLIDYGRVQEMKREDLRFLPRRYCTQPRQSFFAEIDGPLPSESNKADEPDPLLTEESTYNTIITEIQKDLSIVPLVTLKIVRVIQPF